MVYKFRDIQTRQALPLPPGEFSVGREDECYIHTEDTSVSRHHAKIINTGKGVFVEDLGSSNGTAIRGQIIASRTPLEINEIVQFGSVCYRLEPEVSTEAKGSEPVSTLDKKDLRPIGRRTPGLHKDTDRVPLASIHFDATPGATKQSPASTAASTSLKPEPTTSTANAALKPVTPAKVPARATVPLPAGTKPKSEETAAEPPADKSPSTATSASRSVVSIPPMARESASRSSHSDESREKRKPSPPWALTLVVTFGAGAAVGLLAGMILAYKLFLLIQATGH